jgi:segregation and condensation protein B
MTDQQTLVRALEAILFVADEPIAVDTLAAALDEERRTVETALEELSQALEARRSGLVLREIAGGWRLATQQDLAPFVEQFVLSSRHARLTKASLETLAIIAYKQPVTRHQITAIRGVNSDGVLRSLQDRSLIEETGREDVPGRPVLYGTTDEFLERLGLPSVQALPPLAPLLGEAAAALADAPAADVAAALDLAEGSGLEDPLDEEAGYADEEDAGEMQPGPA